jgi:hypothetical protein
LDGKNVDEQCATLESVEGEGGEDPLGGNYGGAEENDLRVFFAEVVFDPSSGAIRSEIFGLLLVWWCERDKIRGLFEIKLAKWVKEGLYKWFSLPVFVERRKRKEKGKKKSGESQRERGERHHQFYEYNNHLDCNSRALYIRLYCCILMFRELYRESAVGRFFVIF